MNTLPVIYYYRAFGLIFVSDLFFPELIKEESTEKVDIVIQEVSALETTETTSGTFFLSIPKVADFLIAQGQQITYVRHQSCCDNDLRLFLLGSCMGALLQQRGHIVLHGNAISVDKKTCTVYVGETGAGKSTLASWYYLQGAFILADDICLVDFDQEGRPYVMPSYPQLKLWQTSADLLGINTSNLRKIRFHEPKFGLPVHQQFASIQLPFSQVTEICPVIGKSKTVMGINKVKALIGHSYRYSFLHSMQRVESYHQKLLRLASVIDWECLPRQCF